MPAPVPPEDTLASLSKVAVFDDGHSSGPSDSTGSEYEPEENLKPILFSQKQFKKQLKLCLCLISTGLLFRYQCLVIAQQLIFNCLNFGFFNIKINIDLMLTF